MSVCGSAESISRCDSLSPAACSCSHVFLVCATSCVCLMDALGHTVEMADNGSIAVDLFSQQHERAQPFDGVLLDMCMPIMDGTTACKRMRELEAEWRRKAGDGTASSMDPASAVVKAGHASAAVASSLGLLSSSAAPPLPCSFDVVRRCPSPLSIPRVDRMPIIAVTASALLEDKRSCVEAGMSGAPHHTRRRWRTRGHTQRVNGGDDGESNETRVHAGMA
jgi:CheY-like chemotaxis protein